MVFQLTVNGVSINLQWIADYLPIKCQLTSNPMSLDVSQMPIDYQLDANWQPIEFQLTVNGVQINYKW